MSCTVTLSRFPMDRKISVIKVVRDITGYGLKQAKDLIEGTLPATVKADIATRDEADAIAKQLQAVGAEAIVISNGRSLEELDADVLGYSGSIAGTPVDQALDEQRDQLFEARAVVMVTAQALHVLHQQLDHRGVEQLTSAQLALDSAEKTMERIAEALDAGNLEGRGLAIARDRIRIAKQEAQS
jgi:Ribosomal protein L7/L12 C-terminal domain